MTPEQLDEVEKLAEAATPGPWATEGESWEEVEGEDDYQPMPRPYTLTGPNDKAIWSSGGGEYAYPDNGTAAFIVAMREHALPLVKAVREAWAKCVELQAIIDHYNRKDGPTFQAHLGEAKALKERDEARAEAKTVRDFYLDRIDELRAEVKQLRGLLKTVWEDACDQEAGFLDEVCDAVEAALKEGES